MKSSYKKYVRIYYALYISAFILFVLLTALFAHMLDNPLGAILPAGGIYLIFLILLRRFIQRKLVNAFRIDPNGVEFQKYVNLPLLRFSLRDRMIVAQYAMDYQTVVNIATSILNNKKTNNETKVICHSALSQAYFDLRDFDKIETSLKEIDELNKDYPTNEPDPIKDYYSNFLAHDYDACIAICEKRREESSPNAENYKNVSIIYSTAVALYEKGEIEAAKAEFESILSEVPDYYPRAVLSKKYIDAIDRGEPVVISENELLPDAHVITKNKRNRILAKVGLTAAFALGLVTSIYLLVDTPDEWTVEYEEDLNAALLTTYDDAKVIDYFWLEKGEETLDNLCLIETDDKLALLSVTTPDNGITSETWVIIDEIVPKAGAFYYRMCVSSNYYIRINFSTEKPPNESLYYSTRFEYNNTKYWCFIDYYENTLSFQ